MDYDPSGTNAEPVVDDPNVMTVRLGDDDKDNGEPGDKLVYNLDNPETGNLVKVFTRSKEGEDALARIGQWVVKVFDRVDSDTQERRNRIARDWKFFTCQIPLTRDFPYPDAPNPHVPVMLTQIARLHARLYSEVFQDWHNIFGVKPIGGSDLAKVEADILRKHGNWQIRVQIPDFKRQMDRLVLRHLVVGDEYIETEWSPFTGTNRHEVMSEDEFFVPFQYVSTMPDISDCPWYIRVLNYYRHELELMRDEWVGVEKLLETRATYEDEPEPILAEEAARQHKVEIPDVDIEAPRKLLRFTGWLNLPGQPRQRYMRAVVDYATKEVLLLKLHEIADWQDRERFDRELRERDQYFAAVDAQQQALTMYREQGIQVAQQPPDSTPIPPPRWMQDPTNRDEEPAPPMSVPIRLVVHQVYIEPFAGNIGFSIGSVASAFNNLANGTFQAFFDQATRANTKSFITGDGPRIPERIRIKPNGIVKIPGIPFGQVEAALKELNFGPANPQLFEIINAVRSWSEESLQSPAALGGAPGKSGEAYRGLMARIEQATKQLSVPAGQISDAFERVMVNNALLNSMFLKDEELILIADGVPHAEEIRVSRKMYQRSYSVEVTSDKRFTTQAERIAEADENMGIIMKTMQIPGFWPNPVLFQMFRKALVQCFEARGRKELASEAEALQQPMMPPPGAPGPAGQKPGGSPGGTPPGPSPGPRGGPPKGQSRAAEPQPGQAPGRVPAPPTQGAMR